MMQKNKQTTTIPMKMFIAMLIIGVMAVIMGAVVAKGYEAVPPIPEKERLESEGQEEHPYARKIKAKHTIEEYWYAASYAAQNMDADEARAYYKKAMDIFEKNPKQQEKYLGKERTHQLLIEIVQFSILYGFIDDAKSPALVLLEKQEEKGDTLVLLTLAAIGMKHGDKELIRKIDDAIAYKRDPILQLVAQSRQIQIIEESKDTQENKDAALSIIFSGMQRQIGGDRTDYSAYQEQAIANYAMALVARNDMTKTEKYKAAMESAKKSSDIGTGATFYAYTGIELLVQYFNTFYQGKSIQEIKEYEKRTNATERNWTVNDTEKSVMDWARQYMVHQQQYPSQNPDTPKRLDSQLVAMAIAIVIGSRYNDWYKKARYRDGDEESYAEGIALMQVALYLNPTLDRTRFFLGSKMQEMGMDEKIILRLWLHNMETNYYYANIVEQVALIINDDAKCIDLLMKLRKDKLALVTVSEGDIITMLAYIYETKGDNNKALEYYSEAIKSYTKSNQILNVAQVYFSRAILHSGMGNYAKAIDDAQKALSDLPGQHMILHTSADANNFIAYNAITNALENGKLILSKAKIQEYLDKALSEESDNAMFLDTLARLYFYNKDYEQALQVAEQVTRAMPSDPTIMEHLGDIYWQLGRTVEADYEWERVKTLNPNPKQNVRIEEKLAGKLPRYLDKKPSVVEVYPMVVPLSENQ